MPQEKRTGQIKKDELATIMELVLKHQWLHNKLKEFINLYCDDCQTDNERRLLIDLVKRFRYVTSEQLGEFISAFALEIVTTPSLNADCTILAAMAADSSPDSSQFLVQVMKSKLQTLGWSSLRIVNTFGATYKVAKESDFARTHIVLVDEFVGSGQTVLGRVKAIHDQFKAAPIKPNIIVRSIFASSLGRTRLLNEGIDFECAEIIKRGISDFDAGEVREERIRLMLMLEEKLAKMHNELELEKFSLGYGKTESLISLENGNIPNNVFPIFWWPEYVDGRTRFPVFTRWMGA